MPGPRGTGSWFADASWLTFLNALPLAGSGTEWTHALRNALHIILPEVDRITLSVDLACRLSGDDRPVRNIVTAKSHDPGSPLCCTSVAGDSPGWSIARRAQVDLRFGERYQAPVVFDYSLDDVTYVGAIILWNERSTSPVSASAIAKISALRQFLLFVMTDGVARTWLNRNTRGRDIAAARIELTGDRDVRSD